MPRTPPPPAPEPPGGGAVDPGRDNPAADTPMMRQYRELKAAAGDALLLYRMGDFYECFFEDAERAAQILELVLTSRNKADPAPIPMAGIPYHALEAYLPRLLEAGLRVAIAEQVEDPSLARARGEKLVGRELVRIVSPGVPWSAEALEAKERCWIAALGAGEGGRGPLGLALLDVSTAELRLGELPSLEEALRELQRLEPRELLVHPALRSAVEGVAGLRELAGPRPDAALFDPEAGRERLSEGLGVADLRGVLGEGLRGPGLGAAGAVLGWVREQARLKLGPLQRVERLRLGGAMIIDEATRRNLELLRPLQGNGRKGTLLHHLDRTCTAMGGRRLRDWLQAPLLDLDELQARQEAVAALQEGRLRARLREALREVADLERLGGRIAQGSASARDLVALRASLRTLPGLERLLADHPALASGRPLDLLPALAEDIGRWLVDEPPLALQEGGLIRPGVHPELDRLAALAAEGKGAIARIEARERQRTGIQSLKVRYNRVFGYFLEVTQANLDRVPPDWMRKQTLANAERYFTPELKEFEETVEGADGRRIELEFELFQALRARCAEHLPALRELALRLSWLDAVQSLAEVAAVHRYCRPHLDHGHQLELVACRHPVVEAMALPEAFVPNDLRLDEEQRLIILTGPNMAGKSTVMRQVALCVLMAQMGGFVPAARAHIGLCDRVFVRVGASDDLAHGRSTFMVEMAETALILNQATERSLVLLDEIGRGTSTWDGLSIAWAVAEAIHDQLRARCIFATHYHELVALAESRPRVCNLHIAVSEWGEKIIFLRRLEPGGASKSYGIQCARLAGMPPPVIERARGLLAELERRPRPAPPIRQLDLFQPAPPPPPPPEPHPLLRAVEALDPDALSPREALAALYRLKELARG